MSEQNLNPRYAAFLTTGERGNIAFMEFIAAAKAFAFERGEAVRKDRFGWLIVVDQEAFTAACWEFCK